MIAFSIDTVLSLLQKIKDALHRDATQEALCYLGDALVDVQNEIDWCYRTDEVLPYILQYLLELEKALSTTQQLQPEWRKQQSTTIISVIDEVTSEVETISSAEDRHKKPHDHVDIIEQQYRARIYGYDE